MFNSRFLTLAGMILVAALSRLLPHPWNFSPVGAMALFAGAHFPKRWHAFLVPLAALFLSDMFLGFYDGMVLIYLSFCVTVVLGMLVRGRRNVGSVAGVALMGSVQFFIITNFATWLSGHIYPMTVSGLSQCYLAAIPFFSWTLVGDAFFTALLFGSFAYAERKIAALQTSPAA